MKKLLILLVVITTIAAVIKGYDNHNQKTEWLNNREVITVTVPSGKGIDYFGYQYKPSWMDVREYRYEVMELNEMEDATLYKGQQIKIYAIGGN
jgi:hypothetical protein